MTEDANTDNNQVVEQNDVNSLLEAEREKTRKWMAKATHYEKQYSGIDPEKWAALNEEIEELRRSAATTSPENLNEYKTGLEKRLRDDIQKELETARETAKQSSNRLKNYIVINELNRLKILDPSAMDLMLPLIDKRTKLVDDNIVILDDKGNERYSTNNPNQAFSIEDLGKELAANYPFAAVNQVASGTMANGRKVAAGSGDSSFERYKTMTNAERAKNFTPQERLKFSAMMMTNKQGGLR